MHNKIIKLIKEKHGDKLNLKDDVYYLILKDAVISLYYDEDTKTIKIDVEATPEEKTFVYFENRVSLEDII
jgi:hypothetical protein